MTNNLIAPLKIGGVTIKNNIILAPMAGFGDVAFRHLCLEYGAGLTVSEMISVKGLHYGSDKTAQMLVRSPLESVSCVQLFGAEPEFFERAALNPLLKDFSIIDINMGCPVHKVVKNGEGSALLKDEGLASEIVSATRKGGRPVTVKMRIGWDGESINAVQFAKSMERAGAAALYVHGRTTEQMYRDKADWEIIRQVHEAVNIPVIGNGDVTSSSECLRRLPLVSGVMIGRGAIGHPEIFAEIFDAETAPRLDIILHHIELMEKYFSAYYTVVNMRKHLAHYLKGVPDSLGLKKHLNEINDLSALKDDLYKIFRR